MGNVDRGSPALRACSPWIRGTLAAGMLAVAAMLAGCETDGVDISAKALKPLSPQMLAELERKHMPKESPILVRLFKEEAELEIWKQDETGRFALLATYPVCRWSGELGPKVKQGDRQAPEGFYMITPAQLNPNSHYYLSFDIGYPNAFDRAYGRTGSNLMVHGDCSSAGCYAMTDEQIGEIYALARESFFGGQRSFQVQAYPFHMTPVNMARHRNNPNMPFWKMLKEGNDHFEVMRLEPKVDVCDKRYVFDAEPPANASPARPLNFNPTGRCPAYQVPQELAEALAEKQKSDEIKTAELISRGTPVAPVRTGMDGGMNPAFQGKYKTSLVRTADGTVRTMVEERGPGTVVYTDVPREPPPVDNTVVASASAHTGSQSSTSGNFFSRLFGGGSAEDTKPQPAAAKAAPPPAAKPAPVRTATAPPKPAPKAEPKQEARAQPTQPKAQQSAQAAPAQSEQPKAADTTSAFAGGGVLVGAQPVVPAGSFESRWSAMR
jgi:murein L,D-transpeptidase YafK